MVASARAGIRIIAVMAAVNAAATAQSPPSRETAPMPRMVNWIPADAYTHTAIGAVIKANNQRVPETGRELVATLRKLGDVAQLPIPFSAVSMNSGLMNPRVVLAPKTVAPPSPEPGKPGIQPKPTDPSFLEGRLYFAANMEQTGSKTFAKTIEFISWNSRNKRFDFGVIECEGDTTKMQILDGVQCFSCHKNKGPILGQGPWSNSMHNDVVRTAAMSLFDPKVFPVSSSPWGSFRPPPVIPPLPPLTVAAKEMTTKDGISLVAGEPEACDAAIRHGGDLVRDREVYKALTKSPDGRQAMVMLLMELANPPRDFVVPQASSGSGWGASQPPPRTVRVNAAAMPFDLTPIHVKRAINTVFHDGAVGFSFEFVAIHKANTNMLVDANPSGSMGSPGVISKNGVLQPNINWSGDPNSVLSYNSRRQSGKEKLPTNRPPSSPRSFVPVKAVMPPRPSDAIHVRGLAEAMGITHGDRLFMGEQIDSLVRQVGIAKTSPDAIAREVFSTPIFTDLIKAHELPDREEFKDLFAAAVAQVAKNHKVQASVDRKHYASGPKIAAGPSERMSPIVPTTSCMGCHDVAGPGKRGFNPIPKLAFDPFDKPGREAWVKVADASKKREVLGRMLKRIATDRDMPPEDSAEYQQFRLKNPQAYDAIKDWLEIELAKAKG